MTYKTEIKNGFSSVYACVCDQNNNWVCNINFNKDYIQNMDNVCYGDESKKYTSQIDHLQEEMAKALNRVKIELDLDKYQTVAPSHIHNIL